MLAILFRPFGVLPPKDFKIICLSNILALSVPYEGYIRNAMCALNLIYIFIMDGKQNNQKKLARSINI
jgi:hypothetical protein